MTEYEKMLRGEVYYAAAQELKDMLNRCKDLCWEYNHLRPSLLKERNRKLQEILGSCDEDTFINQPFLCDFGKHIRVHSAITLFLNIYIYYCMLGRSHKGDIFLVP